MKKYFILTLTLLLCFSCLVPAGAQTMSSDKQALVDKLSKDTGNLSSQLTETAYGSAEYRLDKLGGSLLMMEPELQNAQGARAKFDYKLNSPAQQMGFKCNISYNGKVYQGDVFLSGSRVIFSKDLFQLVKLFALEATIPDADSLPEYLYIDEPELVNVWKAMMNSKGQQLPPAFKGLFSFAVEAIPDKYVSGSWDKITVTLDQKAMEEVILSVLQKIKAEPERFATLVAEGITTLDPSKSFEETRTEILADLKQSIQTGEFSQMAVRINESFKEAGIELDHFTFVTPRELSGTSTLNLLLSIKNEDSASGQLVLAIEQKRSGEQVQGKLDLNVNINLKDEATDIGARMNGTFNQTNTSAGSDFLFTLDATQGIVPMMNVGLNLISKATVDKNIKVDVPVLTPENSLDLNSLAPQKAEEKALSVTDIFEREKRVSVVLNGRPVYFDVQPFIKDKRTMVPVRNLAEALGCRVSYMNFNEVHIVKGNRYIIMYSGENRYTVNGLSKTMDVAPYVKDGRTLVPLRFVAEELGCDVTLFEDTVMVTTR